LSPWRHVVSTRAWQYPRSVNARTSVYREFCRVEPAASSRQAAGRRRAAAPFKERPTWADPVCLLFRLFGLDLQTAHRHSLRPRFMFSPRSEGYPGLVVFTARMQAATAGGITPARLHGGGAAPKKFQATAACKPPISTAANSSVNTPMRRERLAWNCGRPNAQRQCPTMKASGGNGESHLLPPAAPRQGHRI